ncbi:MAG: hypothetical protein K8R90_02745 [Candidatus Cloacimonetes bacterium]|nr:hypothetical protein [Candidatus Cloacimonadota bacterium]
MKNIASLLLDRVPESRYRLLRTIGRLADKEGMTAAVVGGFVRDLFLDRPNDDIDITIEGDAVAFGKKVARKYRSGYYSTPRFGSSTAVLHTTTIDFATARDEAYRKPGALPVVTPSTIDKDLPRRDFTINSMAMDISPKNFGKLYTLPTSLSDLDAKLLRVNHDASFEEDPTRMLRAVRFEQRLGLTIEPHTESLLRAAATHGALSTISGERVMNELKLASDEQDPSRFFSRMDDLGLLDIMLPGLGFTSNDKAFLHRTLDARELFGKQAGDRWMTCMLALTRHLSADQAETFSRTYRFPGLLHRQAHRLRQLPDGWWELTPGALSLRFGHLQPPALAVLSAGSHSDLVRDYWQKWRKTRLATTAESLKERGMGTRSAGRLLRKLLEMKRDGLLPDEQAERAEIDRRLKHRGRRRKK